MEKLEKRSDCPLSCWLDLFGDKWSLLILRDVLKFEKKNFTQFASSPEGIATNILADRLKLLVKHGILTKEQDPNNKVVYDYTITQKGLDLVPIIREILKWSGKYLDAPKGKIRKGKL